MLTININGKTLKASKGETILDVARKNQIEIPTLCHDERLDTYGSCGICVVEVEGRKNLLRSCATEVEEGMFIYTDSPRVRESRKMTLELLLSDHSGDCRPPCSLACPAETDCQGYVGMIANGLYREAVALLKESYPLPASLGLICPHPCEDACRRRLVEEPIAIANLKAFVACQDLQSNTPYMPEIKKASGKKVAIVGSGPAGLTAAFFMAKEGHRVTVYEAMPEPGGMLRYGIPEYRLPKDILDQEIDLIRRMGVKFLTNTRISLDISLDHLRQNYDLLFLGIGAWSSSKLNCPGENSRGVVGGIDFLRNVALNKPVAIGKRVAVVGGGNTAMDAARTAIRLGAAEVMVLYRRSRAEMPAEDIEIKEAEEEGVKFHFLVAPEEITSENNMVNGIRMQKMQLGEADASGRRRPVPIPGEEKVIAVDTVIAAIGQEVNASGFEDIQLSRWGSIESDKNTFMTNMEGVFAGGDGVTGPGIAIEAVAQGKAAAEAMNAYLNGESFYPAKKFTMKKEVSADDFADYSKEKRVAVRHVAAEERRRNFSPVSLLFSENEAVQEASRCLECGCADFFECKLIRYAGEYGVEPERLAGEKHECPQSEEHPFIIRDAAKCILCGLCVRVCDELMGVTALGLVHRGFDMLVEAEFGIELQETDCISCGQCAALCPTGALMERNPIVKNVPMKMEETPTTCPGCGLGCGQLVQSRGNMMVKILPEEGGLLCSRGRFGWEAFNGERLIEPLIKRQGQLEAVSWEEAIRFISKSTRDIRTKYGNYSSAVFTSPSYSVEEAISAAYLAKNALVSDNLSSFSPNAGEGLYQVLGDNLSSNRFAELNAADLIIMVGTFKKCQIAAVKARKAAQNASRLIIISPESTLADDQALIKLAPQENHSGLLKEILAATIKEKLSAEEYVEKYTIGLKDMQKALENEKVREEAQEIARLYTEARKAIIIVDGYSVSSAAVQLMANMAVISGHIGSLNNGIIVISPGGNATGVWQAGFNINREKVLGKWDNGEIKTVFILGEDPLGAAIIKESSLKKTELLVVITPFRTPTAQFADIVLPGSTSFETTGTFIGSDGRLNLLQAAKDAPAGKDNLMILEELCRAMCSRPEPNIKVLPGDKWSKPVHYDDKFSFSDGKARLLLPEETVLFKEAEISDYAWRIFDEKVI